MGFLTQLCNGLARSSSRVAAGREGDIIGVDRRTDEFEVLASRCILELLDVCVVTVQGIRNSTDRPPYRPHENR